MAVKKQKTVPIRPPMSASHKAALAEGREQGRIVRAYLEALRTHKPRRGRKRTPESIKKRLAAIDEKLPTADALTELLLRQERMDLQRELDAMTGKKVDIAALEEDFVKVAKAYGQRKKITYAAWREAGVKPEVLRRAGITRAG
jgi:hypothetical protein